MLEPERLDAISRITRVPDGWLIEPRREFAEVTVLFSNNLHGKIVPSPKDRRNRVCLGPRAGCSLFLKVYSRGIPGWDMLAYDGFFWVRPPKPPELSITPRLTLGLRVGSRIVGLPVNKPSAILDRWTGTVLKGFMAWSKGKEDRNFY